MAQQQLKETVNRVILCITKNKQFTNKESNKWEIRTRPGSIIPQDNIVLISDKDGDADLAKDWVPRPDQLIPLN